MGRGRRQGVGAIAAREIPLSDSARDRRPAQSSVATANAGSAAKGFQRSEDYLDDLRLFLERAPLYEEHEVDSLVDEATLLKERLPAERKRLDGLPYTDAGFSLGFKLGFVNAMLDNFLRHRKVDYLTSECRHCRSGAGGFDSLFYALKRELPATALRRFKPEELDQLEAAVKAIPASDDRRQLAVGDYSADAWSLRYLLDSERRRRTMLASR